MGKSFAFKDRKTAQILKQVAVERMNLPQRSLNRELPSIKTGTIRAYLAIPKTNIPKARRVRTAGFDGNPRYRVLFGVGEVTLLRRDNNGTPTDTIYSKVQRDEADTPVTRTAYNFMDEAVSPSGNDDEAEPEEEVLFCVEDMWGDLYIVAKSGTGGSSSSSVSSSSSSSVSSSSSSSSSDSDSESDSSVADSSADSSASDSGASGSGDSGSGDEGSNSGISQSGGGGSTSASDSVSGASGASSSGASNSSTACIESIGGIDLEDIPVGEGSPSHVLGISGGCLVKVPVGEC